MRGYAAVGLLNCKSGENFGGAARAVHCYGAKLLLASGDRPKKLMRHKTDTMKAYRHIPTILVEDLEKAIPFDCVPVAVDLIKGATALPEYKHPERAFYIFGPEDGTLGKSVTGWCRDTIFIPMNNCSNLAATVNVVLYDRMAKQTLSREDREAA